MLEHISTLISLLFLEAVLAIDNLLAFSLLIEQAPEEKKSFVKRIALGAALILRLWLLALFLVLQKTSHHLSFFSIQIDITHIIFFLGGFFLIVNALEDLLYFQVEESTQAPPAKRKSIYALTLQIIFIDFVFSLDSILVGITLTNQIWVIVCSICFSIIFLYYGSSLLMALFKMSWRVKVLGLLLVILLGAALLLESFGINIDKNVLIATIIFSCIYESLITYYENRFKFKPTRSKQK